MIRAIIEKLNEPKVAGQLRHLLSTVGGVLAMRGVIDGSEWELYVGLGLAAVAFLGSWLSPEKMS